MVFYWRQRGADPHGDTESLHVQLIPARRSRGSVGNPGDLLFVGGDFVDEPFSAYRRGARPDGGGSPALAWAAAPAIGANATIAGVTGGFCGDGAKRCVAGAVCCPGGPVESGSDDPWCCPESQPACAVLDTGYGHGRTGCCPADQAGSICGGVCCREEGACCGGGCPCRDGEECDEEAGVCVR